MVPHPIAVAIVAVTVNEAAEIRELTSDQLRGIYRGDYTNWSQLGGRDQRISIVSRGSESGTRRAFETQVLQDQEPPVSSNDCLNKDRDEDAPVIRCEVGDTTTLLQEVDRIPGAIGYAEMSTATTYDNVERVELNGRDPDIETVKEASILSGRSSTSTPTIHRRTTH